VFTFSTIIGKSMAGKSLQRRSGLRIG